MAAALSLAPGRRSPSLSARLPLPGTGNTFLTRHLPEWLTSSTLADAFPSLHSHFTKGDASVHTVLNGDWRSMLQSRLSPQAEDELDQLRHLLHEVTLEATPDDRICVFAKHDGKLPAGMIYRASIRGEQKLPSFDFVWRNFAPPRVKFFAWLLVQDRI